jgi:restriction system protein
VGALQGQRAKKGVFITTSSYTADATDYATRIDTKVVLIDGKQLAGLIECDHSIRWADVHVS